MTASPRITTPVHRKDHRSFSPSRCGIADRGRRHRVAQARHRAWPTATPPATTRPQCPRPRASSDCRCGATPAGPVASAGLRLRFCVRHGTELGPHFFEQGHVMAPIAGDPDPPMRIAVSCSRSWSRFQISSWRVDRSSCEKSSASAWRWSSERSFSVPVYDLHAVRQAWRRATSIRLLNGRRGRRRSIK